MDDEQKRYLLENIKPADSITALVELLKRKEEPPEMAEYQKLARKLRLAMVTNVYLQNMITADDARELLSGPLVPNDLSTIVDDSRYFGIPDALALIDKEDAK